MQKTRNMMPRGNSQRKKADKKEANEPPDGRFELKANSHCVTGLPNDVTVEELVEVFSKCGIIKEDLDTKKPCVEIYFDKETGRKKGYARVTYEGAISCSGSPDFGWCTPVTQAKFEQKGKRFVSKQTDDRKKEKLKKAEEKQPGRSGCDDAKLMIPTTIILSNMFTPAEMRGDLSLHEELEVDVQ